MRIEQLTFTRFIAAISIVVYHFGMDLYPFKADVFSFLFRQANLGVSYFFILSGFVMIIAYGGTGKSKIDRKKYYLKRIARIYPAYFLALMMLVVYNLIRSRSVTGMSFGMNFFVIQSWFPPYPLTLNAPGWSLSVEFFFYALFPFLFNLIYSRIGLKKLILPILLFWIITQIFFNLMINSSFYHGLPSTSHDLLYYFPLMHLNEFLVGNLGGLLLIKLRSNHVKNFDGPILILLLLLVILLRYSLPWNYHNGLMAIIFLPFILLLSLNNGFLSKLFNHKPLVFLGEISYGIYILQIPVFFWSTGFFKLLGVMDSYVLFYLSFICLIVISGLSYVYLETPIRNAIKFRYLKQVPKIIITSPSLDSNQNVSGISSVTQFIISYNPINEYLHFELGRKDNEKRNLIWFFRILRVYLKWFYLMVTLKDILIHFNLALSRPSIIRDFPLILMARQLGKRMIIHIHGGDLLSPKTNHWSMNLFLKLIFSGKNPVIVLGTHEKKVIQEKFNNKSIFVLPNCIGLKEASEFERFYTKNDILKLLFLGRITEDKGIEYIFLALKSLKKRGIKFKFIMAGKGPDEKIFIPKFNALLGSDFEFKGVVAGTQKTELLKKCNVFLLPSFYEGLPMALIESMSFGLVPITTNVGSIKYIINDGVNGIFVKSHSSEEIVFAIEKLSKDKDYMQKLGNNSRQFIFDNFNPNEYIAKLNEVYEYE